jgi:hypothetical protein
MEEKKRELEIAATSAAEKGSDNLIWLLRDTQTGKSDISHIIFQIFPTTRDPNRLLVNCRYEAVSPWALDLLLRRLREVKATATADLYHNILGIRGAGSLRGSMFEMQVLSYFDGIKTDRKLPIRKLSIRGPTDKKDEEWTFAPIRYYTFTESEVIDKIKNAVETSQRLHLVPSAVNFPAVDSIVYQPNDVLTCIQITISRRHRIAVSGLERIQKWLKCKSSLAGLRPKTAKRWRFIFVLPLDKAGTFRMQKFKKDSPTGVWGKKVDQFVLGLKEETVFGKRSDSSEQGEQVQYRISVFEHC